jgi:hypothetical protein
VNWFILVIGEGREDDSDEGDNGGNRPLTETRNGGDTLLEL